MRVLGIRDIKDQGYQGSGISGIMDQGSGISDQR
jgi:hypothetical protein